MLNKSKVGRVAPGSAAGAPGAAAEVKRWLAGRKQEVALRLLRGEPVDAVSREVAVPIYQLERWRDRALAGINAGLKERENDSVERQLDDANRRIGERVMENEPAPGPAGEAPLSRPEVVAMSRETSAGAGQPYSLERVCRVLEFPRSTIYAQRPAAKVVPLQPARRGPQPNVPDADLPGPAQRVWRHGCRCRARADTAYGPRYARHRRRFPQPDPVQFWFTSKAGVARSNRVRRAKFQ